MKTPHFLTIIFIFILGCATGPATLSTEPQSSAAKLNEKYQVLARVGGLPITLDTREPVARYSLKPKNKRPVFFILLSPKSVKGEIKLPLTSKSTKKETNDKESNLNYSESTFEYNQYIDLMLRAHREVLRGSLDQALYALDKARDKYDESYASLILRGIVALGQQKKKLAGIYFKEAERLFPKSETAKLTGSK